MASVSGQRSSRDSVWVAAIANTILALPGAFGALIFGLVLIWGGTSMGEEMTMSHYVRYGLGLVAVFGPILLGFYLAVGYWKAAFRGAPSATPRRFWWTSALYNGAGVALWTWLVVEEVRRAQPSALALSGAAWTGCMLVLSVTEARHVAST